MTREPPFRLLLVLSMLSIFASMAFASVQPDYFPPEIQVAIDQALLEKWLDLSKPEYLALLGVIGALVVAYLVGAVGMYFFRPWGRSLSLWATITLSLVSAIMLLLGFSETPYLRSGWEGWLTALSDMLWGATLAMAYWSPVSARFQRPLPPAAPSQTPF